MSAALTFDNFAFSYQAATEAELPQNASPHNRTKTGAPLSGPFARKSKKDRLR